MGRRAKPAKGKAEAKRPLASKSPTAADARVRDLEKRLAESLEREKAAGEILRVISNSSTSVQPTFEAIARAAISLCESDIGALFRFDGQLIHLGAFHGTPEEVEASRRAFPQRPSHRSVTARAILAATVVQIDDVSADPEASEALRMFRTVLSVPMIRDGRPLGAITVARRVVRPFSNEQIVLLQTFADQAVIAIENVRLFTDLQTSNRELTTALDTQSATSDILRVISGSRTDVQPVFDAILQSAVRLLGGYSGTVTRVVGDQIEIAALTSTGAAGDAAQRARYPQSLSSAGSHATAIRNRTPFNIANTQTDLRLPESVRAFARVREFRGLVVVPLLRHDVAIGAISVTRREPGGFTDDEIVLLQTFADQAVIAIENVRLFTELQERNREVEQKSRELAAASQHKSEFLANMSHELRTPLNAIIGFSEVLTDRMVGELNEKQDEYLKDIYASGQHLLSLINDILDLSKIEAGRMELELTDFDLPTAIDNALTLVRERAGRRGISLGQAIDQRVEMIRGDERKVKQVLLNLLSNALKFTPEGGRIDVRAAVNERLVEVSVADTGVGIAPEDQEAVFEEFRQVGAAGKKVEGTGLGLALSRKFIELHGGRIWVKSQVGAGSTFTFTLPVGRQE